MPFRISYEDKLAVRYRDGASAPQIETFETEREALSRARELIEEGDCQDVAVLDESGEVIGGIRLQLKLGFVAE
jgi:hypothetical protein